MLSNKYQTAIESSNAFMAKIEDLVREICIQNRIPYYRIESQIDHYPHMGIEDRYMPVIRIITYFEDTVNVATEVLRDEFHVVQGKSIDKKKNRLDSFAYKHVQYIGSLKANRRELTEYKRCGDQKFELQLCSMLQDAWSGIEKELGYDNAAFPDESKRDFYKVGALLEMVDSEFLRMRTAATKRKAAQPEPEVTEVHSYSAEPQQIIQDTTLEEVIAPAEYAMPVAEETPATTFEEHLQTVAHTEPVAHVHVVEEPVIEEVHHIEEPVVVYETPVAETVVTPVVAEEPVIEIPEAVLPTLQHTPAATVAPQRAMGGLVPERVHAPAPEAPAFGIAPQRVAVAHEEPVSMNVSSAGSLEVHAPAAEQKPAVEAVLPVIEIPHIEMPKVEIPKVEVPKMEIPRVETPKVEIPRVEIPKVEIPRMEIPAVEMPKAEIPKIEIPVPNNINTNGASGRTPDMIREQLNTTPADKVQQAEDAARIALDENAPMTETSLREYVINSKLLREIDQRIAERAGAKINSEIDIEGDVERLRFLKVFTLKQLHDRLSDNKNDIVAFAEKWIGKDNGGSFDTGISLFYLEYLLVGKKNDPAFAIEYVVKFISDNDYSARYIIPTYNSIRNDNGVASNFSHLTLRA